MVEIKIQECDMVLLRFFLSSSVRLPIGFAPWLIKNGTFAACVRVIVGVAVAVVVAVVDGVGIVSVIHIGAVVSVISGVTVVAVRIVISVVVAVVFVVIIVVVIAVARVIVISVGDIVFRSNSVKEGREGGKVFERVVSLWGVVSGNVEAVEDVTVERGKNP